MLELTKEDRNIINSSYKAFLYNLKYILKNNDIKSGIDYFGVLNNMFRTGKFCINEKITIDDKFNYFNASNIDYMAVQVMYGVCCCRHASSLFNDILQLLGFTTSLIYIYVDENNIWHHSSLLGANHIAVLLNENNCEYILDPANNFVLKKETDGSLISITLDISNQILRQFENYYDPNIQNIGKTLKKYYNLQKLGIKYVYDYSL